MAEKGTQLGDGHAAFDAPPAFAEANSSASQAPPPESTEPPPYLGNDAPTPAGQDGLIPGETLLLAGTSIVSSSSSSSPPLYELSHAIGHLKESNTKVTLERMEYRVRNATSAADRHPPAPEVASRRKLIFDLTRPPDIMEAPFPYHLESKSRGNLGHVGLKQFRRFGSSGFKAWRASRPHERADLEGRDVIFVAKARGQGRFDWRDGMTQDKILAYETASEGIFKLQIVEALDRASRDALVGTWCLRLWWEIATGKSPAKDWQEATIDQKQMGL